MDHSCQREFLLLFCISIAGQKVRFSHKEWTQVFWSFSKLFHYLEKNKGETESLRHSIYRLIKFYHFIRTIMGNCFSQNIRCIIVSCFFSFINCSWLVECWLLFLVVMTLWLVSCYLMLRALAYWSSLFECTQCEIRAPSSYNIELSYYEYLVVLLH